MAHSAETNQYRGLTPQQRSRALEGLRGGMSPDAAAAEAGSTLRTLQGAAARDGELRTAIDGHPRERQEVARKGDFLAALTRTGGDRNLSAYLLGLDVETVDAWYQRDAQYATVENATLRWIDSAWRPPKQRRGKLTAAELDTAAELLEQGASATFAANTIGVSAQGLRNRAPTHPRLAAALPRPNTGGKRGRVSRLHEPGMEANVRKWWADPALSVPVIAARAGVNRGTVAHWARQLGLPPREYVRGQQSRIPDAKLDAAAELLEQGVSVAAAAKTTGVAIATLRNRAPTHPRLAAALPRPNTGGKRGRVSRLHEPGMEANIRKWWADPALSVPVIAARAGVNRETVAHWARQLGLPPREYVRGQQSRIPDAKLDAAAELLEQGVSVAAAAKTTGVAIATLRNRAPTHPRLAAALPRTRPSVRHEPGMEANIRKWWADPALSVPVIAARAGVNRGTVAHWAKQLGLPSREAVRRQQNLTPDAKLDAAAELLEQGASITTAAKTTGVAIATLRNRAPTHPRLAAALPRTRPSVRHEPGMEANIRKWWADPALSVPVIAARAGVNRGTVAHWARQLGLPSREAVRRQQSRIPDAKLDVAAELLEQGVSVAAAAKTTGVAIGTLRRRAPTHPRLAAALPRPNTGGKRGRVSRLHEPGMEANVRKWWADPALSMLVIAARAGVNRETVAHWARQLGLPSREAVRRQQSRIPDAKLDVAAELLEQGVSVAAAAKTTGVAIGTLRRRAPTHPRLAAALPPPTR